MPSDTKQTGDWHCRNCGYLPGSRVTHAETCDTCHQPVEWHEVAQRTALDEQAAEITRLRAEVADLERKLAVAVRAFCAAAGICKGVG